MYSAHPDFRASKSEKKLCTMYSAHLWPNLRAEPSSASVVRENYQFLLELLLRYIL